MDTNSIALLALTAGGVYWLLTRKGARPADPIPLQKPDGSYDPTGGIGYYDMGYWPKPVNVTTGAWL